MREVTRRAGHRDLGGGGQAAQADPQAQEAVAVVERGGRCGSRSALEGILPQVRPRTHHTVPEANPQLDRSPVQAPRASRPLDLAGLGRLRAAEAGAGHRRRPEAAVGAIATVPAADPDPRAEEFCDTPGDGGYTSGASETLWEISRTPEGQPHGAGQALCGAQESRLNRRRRREEDFRNGLYVRCEIPHG